MAPKMIRTVTENQVAMVVNQVAMVVNQVAMVVNQVAMVVVQSAIPTAKMMIQNIYPKMIQVAVVVRIATMMKMMNY
jgi:hypothetical protein